MQQIKSLHSKLYHVRRIDETEYSSKTYDRYDKLRLFKKLRQEGCSEKTALESIKMSRATYYRLNKKYEEIGLQGLEDESKRPHTIRKPMWAQAQEALVLAMRKDHRSWGKHKIVAMIVLKHGITISASTVGRILKSLLNRALIKPVSFYTGAQHYKPRQFNNHAQRWIYGMKATKPGELIQIDHMEVQLEGILVKHFKAICPITRLVVAQAYRKATSSVAASFLSFLKKQLPFPVISIQVDGGSEFMGDFEQICKIDKIPLFVLPPRSPRLNGHVERGNGTFKAEFYNQYEGSMDLKSVDQGLQKYTQTYNNYRPHQALGYITPWKVYQRFLLDGQKSHMY
jgi:putative transposase